MSIVGYGTETFLYINGLSTLRDIVLSDNIILKNAKCRPKIESILKTTNSDIDTGVALIFLRDIGCQLCINAGSSKELAIEAWNSQWDALILGALTLTKVGINFQCNDCAENFNNNSRLDIVNYGLIGLSNSDIRVITEDESVWIEKYFSNARKLLENSIFSTSVHALSSFKWSPYPRTQLAVLWSGIESLFGINHELSFRLSLYISLFMSPDDKDCRREYFDRVKRLYTLRSKAVHGSRIKEDIGNAVKESSILLNELFKKCAEMNEIPNLKKLYL